MGLVDLRFVASTSRPHLVGIAGPADAGKTTLLAMLFLAIYRGQPVFDGTFSGSYSLQGWENIANYMQLAPGDAVRFPPHTSRVGRVPGLLHLSITQENRRREMLLTDASGEWFSAWTVRAGSVPGRGVNST
jgi:hypothetical protein